MSGRLVTPAISFWNPLARGPGCIQTDRPICKGCGKQIKGRFVIAGSLDFYHPSCLGKLEEPAVVMEDDMANQSEAGVLTEEQWREWLEDAYKRKGPQRQEKYVRWDMKSKKWTPHLNTS